MRSKALGLTVAALLVGTVATPAFADVFAKAVVTKDKDVIITETILITKDVTIEVDGNLGFLDGSAEALALINADNIGNIAGPTDLFDFLNQNANYVGVQNNSGNNNFGILQINQDVAHNNNQGNVLALAFTELEGGIVHAEAGGDQLNLDNQVFRSEPDGGFSFDENPALLANDRFTTLLQLINGSLSNNAGVVGDNQSGGSNNNQHNLVSAAIGISPELALAEGLLGQVSSGNSLLAENTAVKDEISNSINVNTAIVGFNQSGGHNNNQANTFAIAAAVDSLDSFSTLISGIGINP